MPEQPMKQWIQRAKDGDRVAFDRLVEAHRPRIELIIQARLRAHGAEGPAAGGLDVQDVFQEVLLRAFQSMSKFSPKADDGDLACGEDFLRWLGGIAENVVLHFGRQARKRQAASLERSTPGSAVSPSKAMRRDERFERLKAALDKLSPEHREVILLARIEGLKIREIAERMSRSPGAVTQLLWRALENLKTTFGETDSLHLPERSLLEDQDAGESPTKDSASEIGVVKNRSPGSRPLEESPAQGDLAGKSGRGGRLAEQSSQDGGAREHRGSDDDRPRR